LGTELCPGPEAERSLGISSCCGSEFDVGGDSCDVAAPSTAAEEIVASAGGTASDPVAEIASSVGFESGAMVKEEE
jgi:hypothetical protein